MDYGHTKKNDSDSQAFFTSEAGINPDNSPNPEPDNNLDLSDSNWGNNISDVDKRNIGNIAVRLGNSSAYVNDNESNQELGKVIDLEMPTNMEYDAPSYEIESERTIKESFNNDVIRTKDRLDPAGVKEMDRVISRFNQTGNVEKFYDDARAAMEANLDNSYNRKLAA